MAETALDLFRELFLPLYPEDAKGDLSRARSEDANPGNNPSFILHLEDAARVFVGMAPTALGVAEGALELDYSDASVHRLSAALTTARRDKLRGQGAAGTPDNVLFNFVVHGAAYVGACIVRSHGGTWAIRRPLWESVVHLVSRAGEADLPVFHWWLKSLADAGEPSAESGTAASLADRYRAYVEIPCARAEDLPVIAPPDRPLPRLTKVRYDAFYKYLRAQLPEIRDVGDAFPSPERFADYEFKHLSFELVGGGRMLVVHGPTKHGLHAFWLTKEGFEKSAFWPCDAFPAPILRVKNDGPEQKIEILLSRDGTQAALELLWWGP
ncbi:MAG TPA: hypothetical protein VM925_23890 [Labilithrix sp.]|nr:hypothetical protein [Labilithrix sp.]